MDLNNEIDIDAGVDVVWEAMNDVERIAPCLPGAQLQEIDDEAGEYRGIVKVKVGPITAQYKGAASFVEQSVDERRVKLQAKGRDSRGAGTASALITATLVEVDVDTTKLTVDTDLTVTGKVAQFGRGAMADVSAKLMGQFAENVEAMLGEDPAATPTGDVGGSAVSPTEDTGEKEGATEDATEDVDSSAGASPEPPAQDPPMRSVDSSEPEPVDLVRVAGGSLAKRLAPIVGVVVALLVVRWLLRRIRR